MLNFHSFSILILLLLFLPPRVTNGQNGLPIGAKAIDFVQTDTMGIPTEIRFSDYKGEYVLLEFWASWCVSCRNRSANLLKAYKKYHPLGLEIISISLDDNRFEWVNAIRKDELPWLQLSDLNNLDNEVAQIYKVLTIPYNILIGPDGIVKTKELNEQSLLDTLKN